MDLSLVYLAAFGLSFALSILTTRWLRGHAARLGLIDWPGDDRRTHKKPTATVGGMAVFLSIILTGGILLGVTGLPKEYPEQLRALVPILGGAAFMHLAGVWDDLRNLPAKAKLALQVIAASAVFFAGVQIRGIELPLYGSLHFTFGASLLVTVFWFVAITNAFNLLDGADGLAGGAAVIATLSMFIVSLVLGHEMIALFLLIITAAVLGFLHFNFPPATVFLGDGGSLFLGFTLAGFGVVSSAKAAAVVAITIPVVALGLPVLDTVLAVTRRILRGERISAPDRGHIHHRLLDLGHSPRKVALILYGICGMFSLGSLVVLSSDRRVIGAVFVILGVIVWFGLQQLRIPELLELRRVIDQSIRHRRSIGRSVTIREISRRIAASDSVEEVFAGLARGLGAMDLDQAEVWMSEHFLPEPGTGSKLERTESGYLWKWYRNGTRLSLSDSWEIKLPFVNPAGDQVGRLTIRRSLGEAVPAELRVLTEHLVPAVARELHELRARQRVEMPAAQLRVAGGETIVAAGGNGIPRANGHGVADVDGNGRRRSRQAEGQRGTKALEAS